MKVVIDTSYRQFALAPADVAAIPGSDAGQELVVLTNGGSGVVVSVGVRDGRVEVDVTSDPSESWGAVEDEDEVVLNVHDELWLDSPTVENDLDAVFTPTRPGPHHVRVRARGRRRNYDLSVGGKNPVEWYQIAIWPVE